MVMSSGVRASPTPAASGAGTGGALSPALASLRGSDLTLEVIEPRDVALVRLYRYPGADWTEPPAAHRKGRYDPPADHKDRFAVLYMGDSVLAAAMECRIITLDAHRDVFLWNEKLAREYRVARYTFEHPAVFIKVDSNRERLGLDGPLLPLGTLDPYQQAALALYQRFGASIHGLSWSSNRSGQPGRAYGLWHEHKTTIGLARDDPASHPLLIDDPEFQAILAASPDLERIASAPPGPV